MSKILITGALGNVGRYVAKYSLKAGHELVCAGTNKDKVIERFGDAATCVTFDFLNPDTYAAALEGVDCVFLLRPPNLGDPNDMTPFITSMKETNRIKMVCFLSLIGVEYNPIPPHYKIEKQIEKSGLPYCHIRPSFFMQNLNGIHAFEIKHFDRIVVPVKNALTSFIDAEDIGEIIAKIFCEPDKHQNISYSITGFEAIDYTAVAKILSEELDREIIYANPKPALAKKYWTEIRGLDAGYSKVMGLLYLMTRMGTAKKITNTFEQVMGKKPRSFREFAKKELKSWM